MQSSVSLKRLLSEYHTTNNPKEEYARTYKERAGVKLKVRGEKTTQYKQIHSSHTAGLQCPPLYWTKGTFWAQQWVSAWVSDLTDFIKSDAYLFIWQINPNLRSPWLKRCKMNDQTFHLDYPEERAAVFIQEVVATFVWSLSFYAVYSLHSVMLELQHVMFLL